MIYLLVLAALWSRASGLRLNQPSLRRRTVHWAEKNTFERWLEVEVWRRGKSTLDDVEPAMRSVATACRQISGLVRRAHLDGLAGMAVGGRGVNVQGEAQKELDVVTNDLLKTVLCSSGTLFCVASEEEDEPCTCAQIVDNEGFDGSLVAVFDPLDGA